MAYYAGNAELFLQPAYQGVQYALLFEGTRIGWLALWIQSAFIADADAVGVVAACVGSHDVYGTHGVYQSVAGYVEVIAAAVEASLAVASVEGFGAVADRKLRRKK